MAFFIFGHRAANIGSHDVFMYECPYCHEQNTTLITVFARYYHIFWIPFFPYAKEGASLCTHCHAHRTELQFGPKLVEEFKAVKKKSRYPWWTWTWTILLVLLVLSIVIVAPKS
jgi:hypothetical protein